MGPDLPLGVWLHVIEKFPLALGCPFIHPPTYSPIYSFICQYFLYPFIHPYAAISFIHASTCQYFLLSNPSIHPPICQYRQPAYHFSCSVHSHHPSVPTLPTIPSSIFLYLCPLTHPSIHLSNYFLVHLSIYLFIQPSLHSFSRYHSFSTPLYGTC